MGPVLVAPSLALVAAGAGFLCCLLRLLALELPHPWPKPKRLLGGPAHHPVLTPRPQPFSSCAPCPCSMAQHHTTDKALLNALLWALATMNRDPLCMPAANIGMALCTLWAKQVAERAPAPPPPSPPAMVSPDGMLHALGIRLYRLVCRSPSAHPPSEVGEGPHEAHPSKADLALATTLARGASRLLDALAVCGSAEAHVAGCEHLASWMLHCLEWTGGRGWPGTDPHACNTPVSVPVSRVYWHAGMYVHCTGSRSMRQAPASRQQPRSLEGGHSHGHHHPPARASLRALPASWVEHMLAQPTHACQHSCHAGLPTVPTSTAQ